jgi:hypothetical protein
MSSTVVLSTFGEESSILSTYCSAGECWLNSVRLSQHIFFSLPSLTVKPPKTWYVTQDERSIGWVLIGQAGKKHPVVTVLSRMKITYLLTPWSRVRLERLTVLS